MPSYLLVFGAAVLADGTPSGTMRRRVAGAVAAGRGMADARYLPTGGAGAHGFIEADVMRQLLIESGVNPAMIIAERRARNTRESVRFCDAILREAGDVTEVIPCTRRYHLARCAILLRLFGWKLRVAEMPGDAGALRWHRLWWYWLREMLALPHDVIMVLAAPGARPVDRGPL